ncbi:MAG: molybdopterin-dependent oxidoreductase, partial [Alicyclobacillus sp.]|nr:molybdopterin-dependent oxidoreductase [Alicyclobacillus sp.]
CVSCGHCVTVCPCNALMEKSMLGEAGFLTGLPPKLWESMIHLTKAVEPGYGPIFTISEVEAELRNARIRRTKTVCTYCGVGCSFDIWTKGRKILKVEPQMEAPANQISTCVKGKFGWDFVNSPERLTKPLIRRGDAFQEATWDEALDYVASRLTDLRKRYGPDAIGYISSSKCTNEENYLMQKFARAVMGTNNIDNCSRYCQTPATEGLRRTMGLGGDTGSIRDLAMADLVLIVGANPAESHPVLSTRIRRAQKKFGQKLIVADLRKNGMAERADLWLHPRAGTDLIWIAAVTKYILDQGWEDKQFLAQRVEGLEALREWLAPYTLDHASRETGIPEQDLVRAAEMIRDAKRMCIAWAMGVTQHVMGSETSTAICNLLLVTGHVGRPGTGAYPLRGHNNVQGAGDFGCAPLYLPGYERVDDPRVRAKYEQAWGVKLPETPGLDNHQMVEAIHDGRLKAMYIMGEEMALVDSNSHYVREAFAKLDLRGETVWQQYAPMESVVYAPEEHKNREAKWWRDRFMPTNFAFLDDGGFLLADGYGSFYIHRYDQHGKWVSCFGGPGQGAGKFNTPHGIWVDKRPGREPAIVVCDRAHHTLQYFSLDGQYLNTVQGFGLPANAETWQNLLVVPELL